MASTGASLEAAVSSACTEVHALLQLPLCTSHAVADINSDAHSGKRLLQCWDADAARYKEGGVAVEGNFIPLLQWSDDASRLQVS